jgi:hypothetical protein
MKCGGQHIGLSVRFPYRKRKQRIPQLTKTNKQKTP